MIVPILLPIAAEVCRSQLDHGLGPVYSPTHPGAFHAILDQVATRAFGSPTANGEPQREVLIVTHEVFVFQEVVSGRVHRLAFLPAQLELGGTLTQAGGDRSE